MLYPDFNDLIAYKSLKLDLNHPSSKQSPSNILGGQRSPFRGQGLEFDSVRKYVSGDDIRNIDWRVTARTNSPHLKIFREERERHVVLCVDMNASMRFGTKNTFKSVQAAHATALLGWQGIANQDRLSACLFGDVPNGMEYFDPRRSRQSFSLLLKRLTDPVEKQYVFTLTEAFKHVRQAAHTGALVYIISDFMGLDSGLQHRTDIDHLAKRCDVVFIAINDVADRMIFPIGNLAFCGRNEEKFHADTCHEEGRETYEKQWKENRERLYALTSGLKIPLIELTTQSNIRKDLVLELKRLAARKRR